MMKTLHKQFISSYQGESDYEVNGKRYSIRYECFNDGQYVPGVYEQEILPFVGTVTNCFKSDGFPPPEICDLFPGFQPARFNPNTGKAEYLYGFPPKTVKTEYGTIRAQVWQDELEKREIA